MKKTLNKEIISNEIKDLVEKKKTDIIDAITSTMHKYNIEIEDIVKIVKSDKDLLSRLTFDAEALRMIKN